MNAFNNLKTSVKLIGGFLIIAVITAVVGVLGIYYLRQIDAADTQLYQNNTVPISQLADMATFFQRTRVNLRDMLLAKTPEETQTYADTIRQLSTEIDKISAEYKTLIISKEMQNLFSAYTTAYQEFGTYRDQIMALAQAGKQEEGLTVLRGAAYASAKAVEADLDEMQVMKVTQAGATSAANTAMAAQATTIMIVVAVVAALLAIVFGVVISNSIANPLGMLTDMARSLAVGNLVRDMSEAKKDTVRTRKDEIGSIGKAFDGLINYMQEMGDAAGTIADNDLTVVVTPKSEKDELGNAFTRMIASLQEALGAVAENSNNLAAASSQLAQAANQAGQATSQISTTIQQIATGNAQQSESVNQTASSVEQMSHAIDGVAKGAQEQAASITKASTVTAQITTSIQQVSGNAAEVTKGSAEAARAARDGVKIVQATITGMQTIKAKVGLSATKVQEMGSRSDQIGAIVETIDDIASQTNLLALNAAIEAARAGEHGKGFAVVADEVRKLAERSSVATKEIAGLIKGIQKTVNEAVVAMSESAGEVEAGVTQANKAGSALESIVSAADVVYQQAAQATKAAEKMNAAANELVAAVDSVSAVIEENTAATEEMSAGAHEVTQSIENIASVSEENSASVEEVSASAEEMSAQVEEVSASAATLEEMAQALQDVVAQFKLTTETQVRRMEAPKAAKPGAGHGGNGTNGRKAVQTQLPARKLQRV